MNPETLPIYACEADIVRALTDHRVLILEGPTGSGKTTQLPKMLRRAMVTDKLIGVTQPRRIAAVSVAWRIADELGVKIGEEVGYAIRFDDQTSRKTEIKLMTDGILLQEARTDPDFSRYGVIIVDEAHERTLNIDVTLGLLHRALQRRSDLRVVVSSATLQPLVFQRYFERFMTDVPVVRIDARPFPVDILHRPARSDEEEDIVDAAALEVQRIIGRGDPGHILIFLSGEAAIRKTLEKLALSKLPRDVELMPLYGKLTRSEQERIFDEIPGRKVVLATNIAETSITVPGVRFVIDSGIAKIPRYRARSRLSTLFEEGISKASADQRAGRAGRTAPGVCIRLYSTKSYQNRPAFTDEEILRLNLAEVVMRLIDLGVRDLEAFPLPTPPRPKALESAVTALVRMGAITPERELTPIGARMLPFPLSPELSRMVVEAMNFHPRVLNDVLMVASFMSAHSPYLFPAGEEGVARAMQQRFEHPLGDALTAVTTLLRYLAAGSREGFCREHFLDPDVMAFIAKAHRQLCDIAEQVQGSSIGAGGEPAEVVECVLAGYVDQLMRIKGRAYEGPYSDTLISIHPSSALFGKRAQYIVAADVVISSRAYARSCSFVRPEWIAERNPELARAWGIEVRKKKERPDAPVAPENVPQWLDLGGVKVELDVRRGKVTVALPAAEHERLARASLAMLPPAALHWKAELRLADGGIWGRPMSLAKWLKALPHLPLDEGGPRGTDGLPVGVLMEVDLNLHLIERTLPRVLEPVWISRGRQAGWVALISNGEGGFWIEQVADWEETLATTLDAFRDLAAALPPEDALRAEVEVRVDDADTRLQDIRTAFDDAKRLLKQRQG
jgi:ATP-dependent helicase HrpA